MSHFSLSPNMVRGDLFTIRDSENGGPGGGKWKYTVQINMDGHWDDVDIQQAVIESFRSTPSGVTGVVQDITGYQLVVLEPYHRHSHPVCVRI